MRRRPLYVAPHWRNGAIGCAKWAGVKVRTSCESWHGCRRDCVGKKSANAKIANFIAYDTDETGVQYVGVIPVEKVIDPLATPF